jgi:signal transduction histidine kinase
VQNGFPVSDMVGRAILFIAAACCLLSRVALCQADATSEHKRVMLLHSFGQNYMPWSEYAKAVRVEMARQSSWTLDIVDHSLMTAGSNGASAEAPFIEYLHTLYSGDQKLDLIVTLGAPAASFAQRHREHLFPATPLLLAAVDARRVLLPQLGMNDALVAVQSDVPAFIDQMLRVLPDTKTVAVVIGNSPTEKSWLEEIRRHAKSLEARVAFSWYNDLSFQQILKRAAALPPNTAIYWATMNVDAAGVMHEGDTAFRDLKAVTNAPIFSYQGAFFGRGIVGGPMHSVQAQSEQTAAVAIRLLGGARPAELAVLPVGFAPPRYDARELERWGISESLLPQGSTIDFREPTAWERYRWQILLLLAALIFQASLISWLIYEHRRRGAAEVQSRNAMMELVHLNRIATAGELSASIAHEVNQPLSGITLRASAALRWLAVESPDLEKVRTALTHIVAAGERTGDIVGSVRAMFRKEPAKQVGIDMNTLVRTVLAIVRVELQNNNVEARLELGAYLPPIKGDQVQLQQVILNLVMNGLEAMHSVQNRLLYIRTSVTETDAVRVTIEDTGVGIPPAIVDKVFQTLFTTKPLGMGMGLSICRSIIESHGGRIWVSRGKEEGSIFQFELPIAHAIEPAG